MKHRATATCDVGACVVLWLPAVNLIGLAQVVMGLLLLAAGVGISAATEVAQPVRVLLINSMGRENSPFEVFASAFRSELAQRLTVPVAFHETSLDGARFDPARDSAGFVRFLQDRFAQRPPDLVVPIGPLATRFYAQHRAQLFPGVPMLATVAEARIMKTIALQPGDGSMTQNVDIQALLLNIRQLLPRTRRVAVVLGNSAIEQFWVQVAQAEFKPVADGVAIEFLNTLSLGEIEKRVATLPPDSAVLFAQLFIDGAGVSREHDHALARVHAAANAPMFGLYSGQLGKGIVGGPLTSERKAAALAAEMAQRMIGEHTAAAPLTQTLGMEEPAYDARELARWNIADARLPRPHTVLFKPPTLWQQYRDWVIAVFAVVLLQSAMLAALLLQRRRRRLAEHETLQLSGRILTAHEDERRRLARELHDDVTPRLARLAIDASRLPAPQPDADALSMHDELVRLSDDVHAFSYRLHPTVLDDLGLVDALQSECDRVAEGQRLPVTLDAGALPEQKLPTEVAVCLFRIAQEALRNIVRHAQARHVEVALAPRKGGLQLAVIDDGGGFDTAALRQRPGLGLASMRERVRQLGGTLDIHSALGDGTTVSAWVPLPAAGT